MRTALLTLLLPLLTAGCAAPAAELDAAAASAFVPYDASGAFFVKPSRGNDLSRTEVPFLVNETDRTATASVTMGARYGGAELPRSSAYLEVELLDAAGDVVAAGRRMPLGEPTLKVETDDLPSGPATLVILVGGGSDEKANGDHVSYRITAA